MFHIHFKFEEVRCLVFRVNWNSSVAPIKVNKKGCITQELWLYLDQGFVREKEMKMERLEDPTVRNYWILYLFPFLFPHQILDHNTAKIHKLG